MLLADETVEQVGSLGQVEVLQVSKIVLNFASNISHALVVRSLVVWRAPSTIENVLNLAIKLNRVVSVLSTHLGPFGFDPKILIDFLNVFDISLIFGSGLELRNVISFGNSTF